MFNGKKIALVTRIMRRLSFLERTLPTYCKIGEVDEIIIVDWGMKEDLKPLVKKMNDDRIVIIHVPDKEYFDESAPRNVGVKYSKSDYIFMIDCDVLVHQTPFNLVDVGSNKFYIKDCKRLGNPYGGLGGTCIFAKFMWKKVNGYVEGLPGWGGEDLDFYRRLEENRFKREYCLDARYITHIDHGNYLRTVNNRAKGTIEEIFNKNKELLMTQNLRSNQQQYFCYVVESMKEQQCVLL